MALHQLQRWQTSFLYRYLFVWDRVHILMFCCLVCTVYDVCVSLPPASCFSNHKISCSCVSSTVYNIYSYVYNVPSDPTLCRFHSRFRFLLFVSWDALSPLVSCCYVHTVGIHAPQYALRTSCLSPPFLWLSVCHSNTLWHSYTSWLMSILYYEWITDNPPDPAPPPLPPNSPQLKMSHHT